MTYKKHNLSSSNNQNRKGISFRHYFFVGSVVALSLIVPAYDIILILNQPAIFEHHGPNPNTQSIIDASNLAARQYADFSGPNAQGDIEAPLPPKQPETQNQIQPQTQLPVQSTDKPQNISQDSSQSQTQDNSQSQTQVLTQIQPEKNLGSYGIAAGGGLTFLSQDKLDQYFDSLQALGVQWVRWDVDWSVVQEDGKESYNWAGTDRVAQAAKAHGINSLGIIAYAPRWASDKACMSGSQCAPVDPKVFGQFAGKVASRYRDSITTWEIWNEPNFSMFWGPKPSAKKYGDVLKEAYVEIKKASPSSVVLSGGLTPSADEGGSISPITFMNSLYATEANQYFDAVALHPYSFPVSPVYKAGWNSWQQMSTIRKMMIKKGDSGKKIWVTEYGAPTGGPGVRREIDRLKFKYDSDYMSEAAQKKIIQDVTVQYARNADWMGPFFWYSLQDNGTKKNSVENFFGLLRYDGSEKPAYDIFKNAITSTTIE